MRETCLHVLHPVVVLGFFARVLVSLEEYTFILFCCCTNGALTLVFKGCDLKPFLSA